ncbi:MAG: ComEA family DNA-binding protein [Candidatus Atribacteria bacterium]|nr:ComEA family DNA-binding protein [Candidatus Atribacteria bacterium]
MFNISNQEKITLILLLVLIIIGVGIVLNKNINKEDNFIVNRASDISENNPAMQIEIPPVIIHIAGAVKNPGVYQLKPTDRIVDAVKIAGGATEEANLDLINLAALLEDGQKIIVPYKAYSETGEEINANTYNQVASAFSSSPVSTSAKININTANATMLQTLSGIGPVLSGRIIEYRNQNGLFGVIEDIKDVSGIGEKKFEGIKDLICVQ